MSARVKLLMAKKRKSALESTSEKRRRGRVKGTRISVQAPYVISALVERLSLNGAILTYQDLASVLSAKTGIPVTRAEAWRLAHDPDGKTPNHKSNLRAALGLPCTAPMPICLIHGIAHKGKCPRKTFDENAAAYDEWKRKHAAELAERVAWADARKEWQE